ncbi:MAG TPA: shikimate kinase [Anaerolineae bacterium]|nr:shikimate kinase [Anaerolineae bacterium]
MTKTLYKLIGPKGAGKTHIGTLVNQHTAIRFLRVEAIWLALAPGEDGWRKVEAAIDALFQTHDQVMIESLGVGDGFRGLYESLVQKYKIKLIHIDVDLETCLARVKRRNQAEHIAVSDDQVMEYNRIAAKVKHDWDLEIDNSQPAADAEILAAIQAIAQSTEEKHA